MRNSIYETIPYIELSFWGGGVDSVQLPPSLLSAGGRLNLLQNFQKGGS